MDAISSIETSQPQPTAEQQLTPEQVDHFTTRAISTLHRISGQPKENINFDGSRIKRVVKGQIVAVLGSNEVVPQDPNNPNQELLDILVIGTESGDEVNLALMQEEPESPVIEARPIQKQQER